MLYVITSCAWRSGGESLVAAAQARPGALASVLLALAALAALGGGGLTCAALLLLLLFLLRHAGADADGAPGSGATRGRPGAASVPEDVSSEAGCSDASSGVFLRPAPVSPGMRACCARSKMQWHMLEYPGVLFDELLWRRGAGQRHRQRARRWRRAGCLQP